MVRALKAGGMAVWVLWLGGGRGLGPGGGVVQVPAGEQTHQLVVSPHGFPGAVHLVQLGEISGAVHSLAGVPIAGAYVQIVGADGAKKAIVVSDAAGRFSVGGLMAGTYTAIGSSPGYLVLRISNIVVGPGQKVPLNFSLAIAPKTPLAGAIFGSAVHSSAGPIALPPLQKPPVPQMQEEHIALHPTVAGTPSPPPVETTGAPAPAPPPDTQSDALQRAGEAWLKTLQKGAITYKVPTAMRLNKATTVQAVIYGSKAKVPVVAGVVGPEPVQVSDWMRVELSEEDNPDAFTIEPEADQNPKFVPRSGGATWMWKVTPKSTGDASLTFKAWVLYPQGSDKLPFEFSTATKKVVVRTPTVGDYWQSTKDNFLTDPGVWIKYVLPGGGVFVVLAWLLGKVRRKKADAP